MEQTISQRLARDAEASRRTRPRSRASVRSGPKARADLAVVELDGQAVIFDERTGELHHLNESATAIFTMCDGSRSPDELTTHISTTFGVPRREVAPDVGALLRRLRDVGLLED